MDNMIRTLHDFMLYTETITYVLMLVSLIGFLGFWLYLSGRDEDIHQ